MLMRVLFAIGLLISFACYGEDLPINEKLAQSADIPLETNIGGQIFKINRTSALPNIFGKADIFGRTVNRGFVELRFQGLTSDGKILLKLVDIDVKSNETTMNRNKVGIVNGQTTTSINSNNNLATTTGTATTVVSQEGRNEMLPPNTTEFAVDLQKKREFKFGSVILSITDVDETSIKYSLRVMKP